MSYNAKNYTEQGGEITHFGGTVIFEEGSRVEGLPIPGDISPFIKDAYQIDVFPEDWENFEVCVAYSNETDIDYDDLHKCLEKNLRPVGIIVPSLGIKEFVNCNVRLTSYSKGANGNVFFQLEADEQPSEEIMMTLFFHFETKES